MAAEEILRKSALGSIKLKVVVADGKLKEQGEFKDGARQAGYCWYRADGTLWRKL